MFYLTPAPFSQEFLAALAKYWAAKTRDEEREAYALCRTLGLPPSYGEDPDTHDEWRSLNR
jgi:hypothetical protein